MCGPCRRRCSGAAPAGGRRLRAGARRRGRERCARRARAAVRRGGSDRPRPCRLRRPSEPRLWGESPGRAAGASSHPVSPAETRPWGSRFGDVTWARIAPGGLARIELRRIMSRWARTARGEADCVALGSHCASRARPSPVGPASAPVALELGAHRPGPGPRLPGPRRCGVGRTDLGAVVDPVPVPFHPAPAGSARSSLNPRARLLEVRARGLSDDLAGYPAISRTAVTASAGPRGPFPGARIRGRPHRIICYAPSPPLRPVTLCYALFSRTVKGEGA